MKNDATFRKNPLYLGVDIGGTKVQASLVRESGGSSNASGSRRRGPAGPNKSSPSWKR